MFRVDGRMRLPNSDMCPNAPYNPEKWRRLNVIQSKTFKVIDLKSFCSALGKAANMVGPVRDLRVSTTQATNMAELLRDLKISSMQII